MEDYAKDRNLVPLMQVYERAVPLLELDKFEQLVMKVQQVFLVDVLVVMLV
jgi:hypothetical protein